MTTTDKPVVATNPQALRLLEPGVYDLLEQLVRSYMADEHGPHDEGGQLHQVEVNANDAYRARLKALFEAARRVESLPAPDADGIIRFAASSGELAVTIYESEPPVGFISVVNIVIASRRAMYSTDAFPHTPETR